jgi:hypothetical protein
VLPSWSSHISPGNCQTRSDHNGRIESVLIDAVTFLFKPVFDSFYRPIRLFLLNSEVALIFFAAVKILLISE